MRPRTRVAAAAGLALCALAVSVAVWKTGGSSALAGAIVFASQRSNGGWELYAVGGGGGRLRELTAHSPLTFGAPVWSPDGRTIAFRPNDSWALFLADSRTGRLRQTQAFLSTYLDSVSWAPDSTRLVYSTEDVLGRTHLWLMNADGTRRRRLTSGEADDSAPAWSPDGKMIAFAHTSRRTSSARIFLIGNDGAGRKPLTRPLNLEAGPVWSPDGSRLAFSDLGALYTVGVRGGRALVASRPVDSFAWSPDSRKLVVLVDVLGRQQLRVFAIGRGLRTLPSGGCYGTGVSWAPAATITRIAACRSGRIGLLSVDPRTGRTRWLLHGRLDTASWSPHAKRLAFIVSGVLEVAQADGSGAHELLSPPAGGETHPAWSPDGRSIAVEAVRANPLSGAPSLIASPVDHPAWSPDGSRLVGNTRGGGNDVDIVNLKTGQRQLIYSDEGAGDPSLFEGAWSPDGRRIVFASDRGNFVFYDVKRGRLDFSGSPIGGGNPAWSPDGRRLAFDSGGCELTKPRCAIWVADADGLHERRIATNAWHPTWSPDGRRIAFVRLLGLRNTEIYVMNADGSRQQRLTFNPGPDLDPTWQPSRR